MQMASGLLAEEERYLLDTFVKKAQVVRKDGQINLVVPVTQMHLDLLQALRLMDQSAERSALLPKISPPIAEEPLPARPQERTTLAEAGAKFLDRGPLWGQGTIDHYARVIKLLVDVLGGHTPVKNITPDDLAKVRQVSLSLHSQHHAYYARFPIEKAIELAKKRGHKTRSLGTVGRELYGIQVFFNWCVAQWLVERNPAQGISLPRRLMKGDRAREAFLIEDLNKIFRAPLYTGCRNDGRYFSIPGDQHPRNTRFWMPLIALFSGLRLGEIAQLTADNVVEIEGVLCFKIRPTPTPNGEEMLLKTNAARRNVPVHSELLKIGFAEFVAGKSARLFTDLTAPSVRMSTTYYSRWFAAKFLTSVGISGRMVSFHSFRHNFRDALREGGVQQDFVYTLGGWAPRSAANRYGSGRVPVLQREIEKVAYPGLDLCHLYTKRNWAR